MADASQRTVGEHGTAGNLSELAALLPQLCHNDPGLLENRMRNHIGIHGLLISKANHEEFAVGC